MALVSSVARLIWKPQQGQLTLPLLHQTFRRLRLYLFNFIYKSNFLLTIHLTFQPRQIQSSPIRYSLALSVSSQEPRPYSFPFKLNPKRIEREHLVELEGFEPSSAISLFDFIWCILIIANFLFFVKHFKKKYQ